MFANKLIIESPVVQTPKLEHKTKTKARCKVILQTLDATGRNGRYYPQKVIESELVAKQEEMKSRQFLGELDHPVTDDPIRNSTIELKNVSHVILEAWIENKFVHGIIETLTTPSGQILYNLATIDKIPVGFSLRAFGQLQPDRDKVIATAVKMITYDAVTRPSFKEAKIQEVTLEDVKRALNDEYNKVLLESECPMICVNNKCYLIEHFEQFLDEEINKAIHKVLWGF